MNLWKDCAAFRRPTWHAHKLKEAEWCSNCSLMDVCRIHRDLVVGTHQVEFGKIQWYLVERTRNPVCLERGIGPGRYCC